MDEESSRAGSEDFFVLARVWGDQVQPGGDLGLLSDLGVSAVVLGELCGNPDLYPDELLGDLAQRLGFGRDFDELMDTEFA